MEEHGLTGYLCPQKGIDSSTWSEPFVDKIKQSIQLTTALSYFAINQDETNSAKYYVMLEDAIHTKESKTNCMGQAWKILLSFYYNKEHVFMAYFSQFQEKLIIPVDKKIKSWQMIILSICSYTNLSKLMS